MQHCRKPDQHSLILFREREKGPHVLFVPDHGDQGMVFFRDLGDLVLERLFHEPFLEAGHHLEVAPVV